MMSKPSERRRRRRRRRRRHRRGNGNSCCVSFSPEKSVEHARERRQ